MTEKNQIQRIKDGETGPGNAKKGQPRGPGPVTEPKSVVDLTTLPPTADTGRELDDEDQER